MANNVARLGVVLGLNTAEFIAGIENASKKLEQFSRSVDQYAKYGATALAAMSVAAIKFADDIQDVAQANDVAIDTVVKLRAALDASGGSADKAGVMLSAFTKFVDTAAGGSFEAQKAFKSVGVSLKDIGTMTQEQLLGKTLKGLEGLEDSVTRNARAMEFFSKAAKGVAFDSFAQEMQKTNTTTNEQIEAIKAGAKTWDNFERILRKVQLAFVEAIGPALSAINNQMVNDAFPKLTMLNKLFNFIASNAFSAGQAIDAVAKSLQVIAGRSVILQTYGESAKAFEEIKKLNNEYNKFLENQRKAQEQFDKDLSGFTQGGSGRGMMGYEQYLPKPKKERGTTEGVDTKAKAEMEARRKYTADFIKENEQAAEKRFQASLKELDTQRALLQIEEEKQRIYDDNELSNREMERLQLKQLDRDSEILKLKQDGKYLTSYELDYAQRIVEIRQRFADQEYQIKMLRNEQKITAEEETRALQQNNELRQKAIEQTREILEIQRAEVEGTLQQGVKKGFDEYIKNLPTQLEVGKQAFNSLMGSMESAVERFVRTGKFSFKDFTTSVIQDMMVIQAKASAMNMMKGIGSLFGLGGGMGGGMGSGSFDPFGLIGFADGGDPPVGVPSIVGENGPELFVPRSAGTVIPNNQLASVMGNGGQTVNYNGTYIANMSAIDTQSGVQFLAKNKQTIWASYQSANRSVPVSR
jgi:hypothetical protein